MDRMELSLMMRLLSSGVWCCMVAFVHGAGSHSWVDSGMDEWLDLIFGWGAWAGLVWGSMNGWYRKGWKILVPSAPRKKVRA